MVEVPVTPASPDLSPEEQSGLSVVFAVGSPLRIHTQYLQLHGHIHQVQVKLQNGEHLCTTTTLELGTVTGIGNRRLLAWLTFGYEYDAASQVITVCGTDYQSIKGMALVTTPEGSGETYTETASSVRFSPEAKDLNQSWNHKSPLYSASASTFKDIVRGANEALITALKTLPGLTVQVRLPFPELPPDLYLALCSVHRNGKFFETYDPTEPTDEVKLPESKWGGEVTVDWGENFANVIGSKGDPHIGGLSWIRLWTGQFGFYPNTCTSLNFGTACNTDYVGGHVIKGNKALPVVKSAAQNSVYIFPICNAHNSNDSIHMAALQYNKGIWLHGYGT